MLATAHGKADNEHLQARQSWAIGAALLFLLLVGITVGPRLRSLSATARTFNAVPYSAPVMTEPPAIARSKARSALPAKRSSATLTTFVASAAIEPPEFDREEPTLREIAVETLPSTFQLTLPALVSTDQLDHVRPRVIPAVRPQSLAPLYVTFAALQAADAITTIKALENPGLREANPLVRPFARSVPGMVILKGASTTVTVMAVEKLWRKNRVAAVATMVGINVAYGIIVSRNAALQ